MKLKSIIYLCLEKILSPCTDKIVCISKAEKASAEREHIAKDDKLALIPNGIDVSAVRNAGLSLERNWELLMIPM